MRGFSPEGIETRMLMQSTIRNAGRVALFTAALTIVPAGLIGTAAAQVAGYGEKQMGPANEKPSVTSKISIAQHLDQQLPLSAVFTDEPGKPV